MTATIYDNNELSTPPYALNEMLRLYVPSVQKRVFPPGMRVDAMMPRITVNAQVSKETRTGIGEGWGSYKGRWLYYLFRVDVWDRDANNLQSVVDQVCYAIWKHREYQPLSPRNTDGQFILLEIGNITPIALNTATQLYQCTVNVSGRWLSTSAETF